MSSEVIQSNIPILDNIKDRYGFLPRREVLQCSALFECRTLMRSRGLTGLKGCSPGVELVKEAE